MQTQEELSGKDRFRLRMYYLARKYRILSDIEDETIVQFSAYEQQIRMKETCEKHFSQDDLTQPQS